MADKLIDLFNYWCWNLKPQQVKELSVLGTVRDLRDGAKIKKNIFVNDIWAFLQGGELPSLKEADIVNFKRIIKVGLQKTKGILERMASQVKELSEAEREAAIAHLSRFNITLFQICVQKDNRLYGISWTTELLPPSVSVNAFICQLDIATKRILLILRNTGYELGNKFPLRFTDIQNFRVGKGGWVVDVGVKHVYDLVKSTYEGTSRKTCVDIQSQYFHELIHRVQLDLFESAGETIPQLGEFLYDPKNNENRNQLFRSATKEVIEGKLEGKRPMVGGLGYNSSWAVDLRLLLWEYKQLKPRFFVPSLREDQIKLILDLPSLYARVSQEQKNAILAKYITKHEDEVAKISMEYAKELGLLF